MHGTFERRLFLKGWIHEDLVDIWYVRKTFSEGVAMLVEVAVAFVLIFAASSLLYIVGGKTSFKSKHNVEGQLTYACGEKATPQTLTINISLYKYLTYFVAIDSSVLLLAFASSGLYGGNALLLAIYISIIATASFMLVKGRDH